MIMKKIICTMLTAVFMIVTVAFPSVSAYAANKDVIKKVTVRTYSVWEKNEDGFACSFVKFSKVKGASYYQLKYRWYKDANVKCIRLKKNRFHCDGQDVPETIKVRSVKKLKNGKKKYGKWKKIRLGCSEFDGEYSFRQHEKKVKKSKYQSVYFE